MFQSVYPVRSPALISLHSLEVTLPGELAGIGRQAFAVVQVFPKFRRDLVQRGPADALIACAVLTESRGDQLCVRAQFRVAEDLIDPPVNIEIKVTKGHRLRCGSQCPLREKPLVLIHSNTSQDGLWMSAH